MRRILLTVGVLVLAAGSARAHHSYAGFFNATERTVAIEGTLDDILFANPHVVMKIRTADSSGYTVTWDAATAVSRRAGATKDTFKAGDHLVIIGAPARDPSSHEVSMVREVRRPRDQWNWRSPTPFAQPS
jgi:hypothetical protein